MTYRELITQLRLLSPEQVDCDVTVELQPEDEFFAGELRICSPEHGVLDDNHPVIFVGKGAKIE